ncbi:MAG: hypothetical protein ABEI77_01755 [Halorientalis sp.]
MHRPDSFALLFGVYAGSLVFTVVVAIAGPAAVAGLALGAGIAVFATVAVLVAGRDHVAVAMARKQLHVVILAAPLLVLLGWAIKRELTPAQTEIAPWVPYLLVSLVVGLGVYIIANQRILAWSRANDAVLAEWEAAPPARWKWALRGVSFAGAAVLFVVGLSYHDAIWLVDFAPSMAGFLFAWTFFIGRKRHFIAFSDGLYVKSVGAYGGEFLPWSRFSRFAVTDDSLALYRRLPPLPLRSALDDIQDSDETVTALDHVLLHQDTE